MNCLRDRSELRPYQVFLSNTVVKTPFVLLAVEMGLGKTASVLTAVRDLIDSFQIRKVLIIAPPRVASDTWPDEIEAWSHTKVLSYSCILGRDSPKKRLSALQKDCEIHITNRENLKWLWEKLDDGRNFDYDMIVYDESSRLKSGKKRTQRKKDPETGRTLSGGNISEFGILCRMRAKVKRVVELSGTPAPNGVSDLWGQVYVLDQGVRLHDSRNAFLRHWFEVNKYTFAATPKPGAEQEILARISDIMVGLRAEDYLQLPPVRYVNHFVKLTEKEYEQYRDFERELVCEIYDVEAANRGVLTGKLLQFANGGLYRQDPDDVEAEKETVQIHDHKLDALESIISEAAGNPVLVAYSFRFDLKKIKKRFPKAVVFEDCPDAVARWNRGEIPILLAHPASIGHGLNLQHGGFIAVWFGLTWSLELYLQFNMRLPRSGQKNDHVQVHHILASGTADETQISVLQQKDATQDRITEAVRTRLVSNE